MRFLIFFILGAVVGAWSLRVYERREAGIASTPDMATTARESALGVRDEVESRLAEWHLTPDDIRTDLAKTGEVVRSSGRTVAERVGDARIAAVIKAKYVLDRDLSARSLQVACQDGRVTLDGTVPSAAQVGRAIALALDTDGVAGVSSRIRVQP